MSKRKVQGVDVEIGTGNVYADLGYDNADVVKATPRSRREGKLSVVFT